MASSIDRTKPATNSPLLSQEMRDQFNAAADDHETLESGKLNTAHATDLGAHGGAETHVGLTNNPHGVTAGQVGADPSGTADALVTSHETAFNHNDIPNVNQKAAMDVANSPSAGNAFATIADIVVGGEANTQTNLGGGAELGLPKNGLDLPLRTFVSGDGSVSLTPIGNTLDIRAPGPVSTGTLRTIRQNTGADISDGRARLNYTDTATIQWVIADDAGGNEATIGANFVGAVGEVNTYSTPATVGGNEAAVTMAKNILDLPFRKLVGSTQIGIAQGADAITFSVPAGSISETELEDAYALRSIVFAAGDGLSGGGTGSSATVTYSVNATVLRTTGAQTVTGAKDFTGGLTDNGQPLARESAENTTAGQLQIAVVAALPGTPDANTIYFVT